MDYINQRFQLSLEGTLAPTRKGNATRLEGQADLGVTVVLPPGLWMTPKPILVATGNGLLKSILMTVKQRLVQQIVVDYQTWCKTVSQSTPNASANVLPAVQVFPKARTL